MNTSHDRSIITAVQKLTGTFNQDTVYLVTANVISVDENKGICTVETISGNASITLTNVELQTVISDGILIVPRKDSEVKVIYSKYTTPFIVQYSEVEKIYFAADTKQIDVENTFNINCNKVIFNGGSNKGMVKVVELTQQINKLENKVNSIISTFNFHTHAGIQSGGGNTLPPTTNVNPPLTPTQQTQIEDTKITH
jgi:hypothetical protein